MASPKYSLQPKVRDQKAIPQSLNRENYIRALGGKLGKLGPAKEKV
jgi:hypothetical protein